MNNTPQMPAYNVVNETQHIAVPVGSYQAVLSQIIVCGTSKDNFGNEYNRAVLGFEIPSVPYTLENGATRPSILHREVRVSFAKNAWLGKLVAIKIGRPLEHKEAYNLFELIGLNTIITVEHNDNGYEKIPSAGPVLVGMPELQPNYPVMYVPSRESIDPGTGEPLLPKDDPRVYIPSWVFERVKASAEYAELMGLTYQPAAASSVQTAPAPTGAPVPPAPAAPAPVPPAPAAPAPVPPAPAAPAPVPPAPAAQAPADGTTSEVDAALEGMDPAAAARIREQLNQVHGA